MMSQLKLSDALKAQQMGDLLAAWQLYQVLAPACQHQPLYWLGLSLLCWQMNDLEQAHSCLQYAQNTVSDAIAFETQIKPGFYPDFMRFLQALFFLLVVRPLVAMVLGVKIRSEEHLPMDGPAIIAANHNSHLDTLTLMSLWPLARVHQVRPVAAADYFLSNAKLAWFSLNIMHIIPIDRNRKDKERDPLAGKFSISRDILHHQLAWTLSGNLF